MKEEIKKIKKLITGFHIKPVSYKRTGISPKQDWITMLAVTAVVCLTIGVVSFVVYSKVEAGTLYTVPADSVLVQTAINSPMLKKTVDTLNLKAKKASMLLTSSTTPADPSL